MNNETLSIVTCSYAPDAWRCRRLCDSVDRFVPEHIEHCVIVPRRDLSLFSDLQGGRRRLLATEDTVPAGFRQLPFSSRWWLSPEGLPVRGWIMQQITKLSADRAVNSELILFADSDLTFIRPYDETLYYRCGELRLHRIPNEKSQGQHLRWHHRAASLLGEEPRYFGSDYVGQLITWRRSNLMSLQGHLEAFHRSPWHRPVARSLRFSEYVLYGAYVEHVLGQSQSRHFYCEEDACHCCWFAQDAERLGSDNFGINPHAQALLVQSNIGLQAHQEAALLTMVQQANMPTATRSLNS